MIEKVVLIGAGNVATYMGIALQSCGIVIEYVYSQSLDSARILGEQLNTKYSNNLLDLPKSSDLYVIAISDDAIKGLAGKMDVAGLVVHTSGTLDLDEISIFSEAGVFYPLQSFSKGNPLQNNEFPICIETSSSGDKAALKELASKLVGSQSVYELNSKQRKAVHLAAVFASNYSNYMYQIAEDLLKREDLNLDILRPLIVETAEKVKRMSPKEAQTGPAKRGDTKIMEQHKQKLESDPDYKKLYELISESIVKRN